MNKVEFTLEAVGGEKKTIELNVPFYDELKVVGGGLTAAHMIGINEYIMWNGVKWRVVKKFIKDWSYE